MPVEGFVGLAFGVSGLFALFNQCLAVYRHIDQARYFGENVWQQYVMFEHQYLRFESWQHEVRWFQTVPYADRSQLPGSSLNAVAENLLPPAPEESLRNILAQILSILQAVQALCEKYRVLD